LCLVYEELKQNLREVLAQFGKGIGLSLKAVCLYAGQLFEALSLMHRVKLIHADLKPDNVMVAEGDKQIKLCDFGSVIGYSEID
jgi:serine/threonine-protein kinase PRP4